MQITIRVTRSAVYLLLILAMIFGLSSSQANASGLPADARQPLLGGQPVPGGPGFVSLNAYDFSPINASQSYFTSGTALCNSLSTAVLVAPLHLPNGARINKLVAYYMDNDSTANLTVNLELLPLIANSIYSMATANSSGTPPSSSYTVGTDTSIDYSTVNLAANSYAVRLTLGAGATPCFVCLTGVRVDYDYASSLPMLNK